MRVWGVIITFAYQFIQTKKVTMSVQLQPVYFSNFSKTQLLKGFNLVTTEFGRGYQPGGRTDRHLCGMVIREKEGVFHGLKLKYWEAWVYYFTLDYLKENNLKICQNEDHFVLSGPPETTPE